MDPLPLISIAASALIEMWRIHAGKPAGWKPSPADWDDLLSKNAKTAEDYEAHPSKSDQ